MTKTFSNLGDLAALLTKNTLGVMVASEMALGKAAKIIQADAKDRIGHYQSETGAFQDWAPLADSTEAEKARLGYPADAPLLREGDLRESIVTEHHVLEAVIGSKLKIAAYQEFGTEKIPPRPFLGPAAYANRNKVKAIIGAFVMSGLVGNSPVHPLLGYNQEVK